MTHDPNRRWSDPIGTSITRPRPVAPEDEGLIDRIQRASPEVARQAWGAIDRRDYDQAAHILDEGERLAK